MNGDMDTADAREYAALTLLTRGVVALPLRPDIDSMRQMAKLRTRLWLPGATLENPTTRTTIEFQLSQFRKRCRVEMLTGAISGVVAIAAWDLETICACCLSLPDTPARIDNAAGLHLLYQYPGPRVVTHYLRVGEPPGARFIQVFGDYGSLIVPPSAFGDIEDWPLAEEMPEFDPAWLDAIREAVTEGAQETTA